jgi:hypothetical protein
MTGDFFALPAYVQAALLWDMELDYDCYDSSKAECIHGILCGTHISHTNEAIIKNFYHALTAPALRMVTRQLIDLADQQVAAMEQLLKDTK